MSLLDELLAKAGTTPEAWRAAREERRVEMEEKRAAERAFQEASKHRPMTGVDLLSALLELSDEDLAKPISTQGCDCWGDVGEVQAGEEEIELWRT